MLAQERVTDQLEMMVRMKVHQARSADDTFTATGVEEEQLNKSIKELKLAATNAEF